MRLPARLLLVLCGAWGWAEGPVCAEGLRFQGLQAGFAAHRTGYDAWVSDDGAMVTPAGRLQLLGAHSVKGVWVSSEVFYRGVYPGIDLVYYSHGERLEYDFVVAPGGDPGKIAFAIAGAAVGIGTGGTLLARTTAGEMRLDAPFIYQAGPDGVRQAIRGGYAVDGDRVSFRIGDYDRSKPLVIDPVLSYATFVGQNGDGVSAATADSSGNAYLVGKASGVILVEKVSPAGAVLLRQTVGTTPYNFNAEAVAVTSAGAVYITGTSDAGLPTTANAYLGSVTSGNHAFIAVLNSSLTLTYCSYIAGTGPAGDQANGIAVDSTGNAYITGLTDSSTFPVTAGAYQSTASTNGQTGFVSKINPSASGAASLVYSTYLGGPTTATDLYAIALDSSNNAYLTGQGGADFPVTAGTYQYKGMALGDGGVFAAKLNATGTTLAYSAYLGYGVGTALAVDGSGNAYVTGYAEISDFPTTTGAYQTSYPGAFVLELNTTATSPIYSTFLTGPSSGIDYTEAIPTDIALPPGCTSACSAYIAGFTNAIDFPVLSPIQSFEAGGNDDFIVELSGNGAAATYSTYLGGSSDESNNGGFPHLPGIGVMSTGDVVIGGETESDSFPITLAANPVPIFAARINAAAGSLAVAYPTSLAFSGQTIGVPSAEQTITLRNLGSTALATTVATAGDYSQTNTCGSSLAAGAECSISATFTPTSTTNPRTGTITLNGSTIANLTGSGANAGYSSLTPATLNFGSQMVGSATASQTITLSNIGNQALTLSASSFGTSGDFAQSNNCPASLAANTSCTVSVSFLPTQEGLRSGSLAVSAGNNASPNASVSLTGTGVAGTSALTLNGSGLVFNPQAVGSTSPTQSIAIINTGNVPVTIQSANASGDYLATGCVQLLNPGAGCDVRVTFTPTAAGARTSSVTIVDTTPASPHSFTLTGTGLADADTITITPTALVFSDQPVGQTTAHALPIYVTNTGTTTVTFDRIVESGDYRITGSTCGTLSVRTPPATCTISVVFTPTATGARTGTITFTDSATGSPQTVTITGNGLAVDATATLSPGSLNFANQPIGLATTAQNVVITNTGNVPITIDSATITGTNAGDFGQTNGCVGGILTPARTCTFAVTFNPTATGSRTATLDVTDDAGTQTVTLSGTGLTASIATSFVPASMTFQSQATGTTSPNQLLIVVNSGDEALGITNVGISGNYTLVSNPCVTTIQPNAGCTLTVNFVPSGATGTQTGTVTFTDNAGTQTVNLSGQNVAAAPAVKLSPSALAFTIEPIGTAAGAQTVTVTNTTASTLTGLSVGSPSAPDFVIASGSNNCGTSLNANASCSFQVIFTPTAAGSRTGTTTISNSAGNQTLNLAGFGEAATLSAYVHDSKLIFPSQVIATSSGTLYATLTNNGVVPLTISSVTISAGDFAISNGCPLSPSTMLPNQSCSVGVTFTPTAAGNRTATVTITDNAPGSPRTVTVSGAGLTATETLEADYTTLVFPTESIGDSANQPDPETITLTNTGNSPVTISSIVSSSTDFVVNNGCPLSPSTLGGNGGTCQVSITFAPSVATTRKGTLTITSSAPGSPLKINMSGLGVSDTSTVDVTPVNVAFIPQTVGTSSGFTEGVYVTNAGDTNISVTSATVTTGYSLSNGCNGAVLAPTANCSISISFTPTAAKVTTGTLTIKTTGKPATTTVSLTGTGLASSASISLSQTNVVFDQQVVGVASQPQVIYYYNQGSTSVTLNSVVLTGADFAMNNGCSGTGGPLASCSIKVTFNPTATGLRTGKIVITDTDPGSPRTINLSGTGVAAAAPQATVTPGSLTFASQPVGSTSAAQNINLTNSGEANLTINGISVTGANATAFPQTNNCPSALVPQFSCTISVKFAPTATGAQGASLSISDNAAGSPQTVSLSGTGTAGTTPVVTFTPSSLTFSNVPVNTTSSAQTAKLQNTGAAALTITNIATSGTVPGDFAETNNCPSSVAVGGTCTIQVTFTPSSVINQTGAVTVTDNTPNGSDVLALAGNGTAPVVNLSTTSLAFGNQQHGTTSPAKTVTLENAGNLALTINSITATKDYNIVSNTCPASLAPGLTCTFGVTFSPSITGTDNGSVTISDNAGDSPQTISLTGSGT
jgi:hypothetical protein